MSKYENMRSSDRWSSMSPEAQWMFENSIRSKARAKLRSLGGPGAFSNKAMNEFIEEELQKAIEELNNNGEQV